MAQKYYHARLMSAQTVIDSLEFARAGQELRGSLPVTRLTRLQDCLFDTDTDGDVQFAVRGGSDGERRPMLQVEISGTLHLQCQRCLEVLEYPLRLTNTLLLVRSGEDMSENADDPEAVDCIEASPEMNLAALIEDEILLSLPFAPRHADDRCQSAFGRGEREAKKSPAFAKLAGLKDSGPRQ
jgi:uncharacterized protein